MIRVVAMVLLSSLHISHAGGGSCGSGAIPFRFEVSAEGQPVLGCGTPQCFGYGSGGEGVARFTESVFLRDGDESRRYLRYKDAASERARCPFTAESATCAATLEWVGGFEYDGNDFRLQCCRYDRLKYSAEVGRPVVHAGEVYSGGEVLRDGRQTGFDLIKNIHRIQGEDGSVAYELTVARMNCLPDPAEELIEVEINQSEEIGRILDKVITAESSDSTDSLPSTIPPSLPPPPPSPPLDTPDIIDDFTPQTKEVPRQQQPTSFDDTRQQIPIGNDELSRNTIQDYQPPTNYGDRYVQVGEQITPVITPGYYYPVSRCDWCQSMPACFTGEMEVETRYGTKRMDELMIGDEVITIHDGTTAYTPIVSWQHRLPNQEATFLRISTNFGDVIEMTPLHMIWKVDCDVPSFNIKLVHAEKLRSGDCLYTLNDKKDGVDVQQVNSTVSFISTGAYSPMTKTGDFIVNGVYASCHNVIQSSTTSQSVLKYSSYLDIILSYLLPSSIHELLYSSSSGTHLPLAAEFLLNIAEWCIPGSIASF